MKKVFHPLYTCPSPKKSIFLYRLERSSILFSWLRAVWRLGTNKIIVSPDSSRADGTEQDLGASDLALRAISRYILYLSFAYNFTSRRPHCSDYQWSSVPSPDHLSLAPITCP